MRFVVALAVGLFLATSVHASVTRTNVNCRAQPSTHGRIVERITAGERVTVSMRQDDWAKIDRARACWVSAEYLADGLIAATRSRSTSTADRRYTSAETKRANKRSLRFSTAYASRPRRTKSVPIYNASCPCSGSSVCIGPRGGRYCITSGGNKRYGV